MTGIASLQEQVLALEAKGEGRKAMLLLAEWTERPSLGDHERGMAHRMMAEVLTNMHQRRVHAAGRLEQPVLSTVHALADQAVTHAERAVALHPDSASVATLASAQQLQHKSDHPSNRLPEGPRGKQDH